MSERTRVLYVEDDLDIRTVAELALEGEGFELVCCRSGPEAIEKAADLRPDLLLIDVMMPGMDGPTTLARLRELPHLQSTPVIFMTAKIQVAELDHYRELGALGVIPKPFDPMSLAGEIRARLAQGQATLPPSSVDIHGLADLARAFAESLPSRLARLEAALEEAKTADPGELPFDSPLRRHAHNLAGGAGTFGFHTLGARARALELRLREPDVALPLRPELTSALADHWSELGRLAARGPDQALRASVSTQAEVTPRDDALVYVLEDDALMAEEISRQLQNFGYTVESFGTPRALEAAYSRQPPAALVADVVFPEGELEGPRVAAALQTSSARSVPVVYVSVRDDWGAQVAAIRAGGRAYLPKPIDFGALAEQLDRLTGRAPEPPLRVLILEDDALLAEHYAFVLRQRGMLVEVLLEPSELLARLSSFSPDLLLVDVYLPGCTGVEVTQVVRQNTAFKVLPIAYLSTEHSREEQLLALSKGGDDFLQKPIPDAHLVAAVEIRAKRFRELSSLATRDGLTGLLNHLSFKLALERELARLLRGSGSLCLAMLDVDDFKQINDRHGHPAGDRVLRSLGRLLSHRLRKADVAGRYGGEEFVVMLPDTSLGDARIVIDELRQSFSAVRYVHGSNPFHVTFSAGLASAPLHHDMHDLLAAADQAMYVAKRAGRNRVEVC